MSASSKKKLRKEQAAEMLTERQQKEKKDAKKLKVQSTAFICVIALIFAIVLGIFAYKGVVNSGLLQKVVTGATIGERKVKSATLNYFYMDAIANQYSNWQKNFSTSTDTYLQQYFGLDVNVPLDEQYQSEETKLTWADYFVDVAISDAQASYAIYDMAVQNNHTLSAEAQEELDTWVENYQNMAEMYQTSLDKVVQSNYGPGSTFNSWKEYVTVIITAQDYASSYAESLKYDDAAIAEIEKDRKHEFNAYSFASYHLSYTKYPDLGTTGEDGKATFSDEQKTAALEAAKKDAESLVAGMEAAKKDPSTLPEVEEGNDAYLAQFDKLIAALKCNEGNKSAISTKAEDSAYKDLPENIREWLSDPQRKEGDTAVIANTTTTTAEDGTETTVTNGYYALYFTGINDNSRPLANVRHLLVEFEGGTTDAEGNTTYSEDQKNAAKAEAEKLLAEWEKNPTQENFIELVKENSDDTTAAEGGLFEDISPDSNYVSEFLDWSLDENRKAGDTGIIETQYGYHIMYYVEDDEVTYREQLISNEMKETDYSKWYEDAVAAITVKKGFVSFLKRDYLLASLSANYNTNYGY